MAQSSDRAVEQRYGSLRSLASGLAAAVTVDDVCQAIASNAPSAVGADAAVVAILTDATVRWVPGSSGDEPTGISRLLEEANDNGALHRTLSVGAKLVVGQDVLMACPAVNSPGLSATIVLSWSPSDTEVDAQEGFDGVISLCGAALIRAWATRSARELGSIMDALLGQAPIGFAFIDTDLRYVHINERLAEFNGHDAHFHLGKTVRQVVPNLADELEPLLRGVIESGVPTDKIEVVGETRAETDADRVFEAAYLPVFLDDDEVVGIAAVVDDVTEQRRSQERLERRYAREHEIATRLQRGLTPRSIPSPPGYELAVRYVAGSGGLRIGGDWYDLIELHPDRLAVVVGDVVGHGLGAALAMVRIRHALAGLCHAVANPSEVLDRLDEYATDDEDRFVATLVYGLLDPRSGTMALSSAGHPPPLIVGRDGNVTRVNTGRGTPIGIAMSDRPVTDIALKEGDSLVLYTDGVFEERGASIDAGLHRLIAVAAEPSSSAESLADRILAEVPSPDHSDDIALMILRRCESRVRP